MCNIYLDVLCYLPLPNSVCLRMIFPFDFQRNEYIFTLMEPKKGEKRGVGRKAKERNTERHQRGAREVKRVKNNEEHRRLILGLRLSRKHLHFLFGGHEGVTENWRFEGTQLADNQWHTLVLTIGSHHASLTVDCRSPLEM